MKTIFSPFTRGASLLIPILLSTAFYSANAQRFKISVRSGASMSNYFDHKNSGPESNASNPIFTGATYYPGATPPPSYNVNPNPYYKTSLVNDMRTGFYAGVYVEMRIKNRFSIEHGLAYVQKGIDLHFSSATSTAGMHGTYSFVRSINTNYISIPLVAKYYLGKKEHFYIVAGGYDAFAVRSRIKDASITSAQIGNDTNGLPVQATSSLRITAIKTFIVDSGLIAGGGFNLPLSDRISGGLDARVNLGLINLKGDSAQNNYASFSQSAKNINLEVGLRVAYALSTKF